MSSSSCVVCVECVGCVSLSCAVCVVYVVYVCVCVCSSVRVCVTTDSGEIGRGDDRCVGGSGGDVSDACCVL